MKKSIIYVAILLLMGGAAWYFLKEKDGTASIDNTDNFTVKDTASIYKIMLARRGGTTIKLERKEHGWMLNDTYEARPASINQLLTTLAKQRIEYPVPVEAHNNVVRNIAGTGIKVELRNKKNDIIKVFYVGGSVVNKEGTYMIMENSKVPYVVNLPFFNGYLTPVYEPNIPDWRKRNIFAVAKDNIKKIDVSYYGDKAKHSFSLTTNPPKVNTDHPITAYPLNTKRYNAYIEYYQDINAEAIINGQDDLDSLFGITKKFCTIAVTDKKDNTVSADIFWMPMGKRSMNKGFDHDDLPQFVDVDRLYAVTNNNRDTLIIQSYTFNKLFKTGYEFYLTDDQTDSLMRHRAEMIHEHQQTHNHQH